MACMKIKCIIFSGHLIIYLLALSFLVLSSLSTPIHFMAQGRQLPRNSDAIVMRNNQEKGVKITGSKIGSRPPRCDKKCESCGHCEAVQVPIAPAKKLDIHVEKRSHFDSRIARVAYSRGDDISNYKPMCWKCKCGDFIFNPW